MSPLVALSEGCQPPPSPVVAHHHPPVIREGRRKGGDGEEGGEDEGRLGIKTEPIVYDKYKIKI